MTRNSFQRFQINFSNALSQEKPGINECFESDLIMRTIKLDISSVCGEIAIVAIFMDSQLYIPINLCLHIMYNVW